MIKAIALFSGGLDSSLAIKILEEQGIKIVAVNFISPFCLCDKNGCKYHSEILNKEAGVELKRINISRDFLEMVGHPKFGYGSNMNPCIDCRILMLNKAKDLMRELNASFLITGEVLGQRPMSQHRKTLALIEKETGLEGLILRPLSAKLLEPTIPEEKKWVDREKLMNISGRTRKPQISLAKKFNFKDWACPAGGCLLTDPGFARRLKDLMKHKKPDLNDIELLKIGRHFRLSPKAKLIVGRDEKENNRLEKLVLENDFYFLPTDDFVGPSAIGRGEFKEGGLLELAARIIASHCDQKKEVNIECNQYPSQNKNTFTSSYLEREEIEKLRI